MRRLRPSSFAVSATLLLVVLVLLVVVLRRRQVFTPPEELTTETPALRPLEPRPIPAELEGLYRELSALEDSGDYAEVADRYLVLLSRLAGLWGESHPDLAPYYHDFAFALRRAGERRDALAILLEARRRWPDDLRLQVLDASLRAEAALVSRRADEELDALFRSLLRPSNHKYLRGLEVDPEALYVEWAAVLLAATEASRALEAVERALELAPAHKPAQRMKARVLVGLGRSREAVELLERLVKEESSTELEYHLAVALLDTGRVAEANERFTRLLEEAEAEARRSAADRERLRPLLADMRHYRARALVRLGRAAQAADLLLRELAGEPGDTDGLRTLAEASRQLGAAAAAAGLEARIRELASHERAQRAAAGARARGDEGGELFFEALEELAVERVEAAFDKLRRSIAESPEATESRSVYGWALEAFGRFELAARTYDEALAATKAPLFILEKARLEAHRRREEAARDLLADPRLASQRAREEEEPLGRSDEGALIARRLRVYLELGDLEAVREFFRANPADASMPRDLLLASAELALADRRLDEASTALSQAVREPAPVRPEEASWAGAIALLLDAVKSTFAGSEVDTSWQSADPSDLFDHPRLVRSDAYTGVRAVQSPVLTQWIERLRGLEARRAALFEALETSPAAEITARSLELLQLYREAGALRKAREVARHLFDVGPQDLEAHVRLAEVLSRPEDVVERLSVVEAGLRLDAKFAALLEMREEARGRIGLGAGSEGTKR